VALAGDAAKLFIHRIRVTFQQILRRLDANLAKVMGHRRTDTWDVFEAHDLAFHGMWHG
jgi:hypothetical protein